MPFKKRKDGKEINSNIDARRVSFDLNGILIATYWTYLVEKNDEIFDEARSGVLAKLEGLATARITANAFKSQNAWKEYLEVSSPSNQPLKKSIFRSLERLGS